MNKVTNDPATEVTKAERKGDKGMLLALAWFLSLVLVFLIGGAYGYSIGEGSKERKDK